MGGPDELFRRYLQTRVSLGDPPAVFPALSRRAARRLARRAAIRGVEGLRPPGGGAADAREAASGAAGGKTAGERPPDGDAAGGPRADDAVESVLPGEEVERLAREATGGEIAELDGWPSLRDVAVRCVRCPLHESRTQVVFGEGNRNARLVCVGEAPGAREDDTGRPFVGRAGQLLDRLLLTVGFRREEVYICNVLKCRPPSNRDPRPEEIDSCSPYLYRQIALLDPAVVVAFGAFASRTLLQESGSLGSLRGRVHRFRGYPLVATYHPAALLRNPGWTRPTWEDLQRARRIVDDGPDAEAATGTGG